MAKGLKKSRKKATQIPGRAQSDLAGWRGSLQSAIPQAFRPYADRIMQALLLRDEPPGAKPDYSKPGKTGTQGSADQTWIWDPDKKKWEFMELPVPEPFDPCATYLIEVDIIEDSDCPPAGGFAPMLRRAIGKAREEAATKVCPPTCFAEGEPFVEITYREWDCKDGVASVSVQVAVRCDVL